MTNWTQFRERFGDFVDGAYLPHAVYGYFQNGGGRCYVVSVKTIPQAQVALLNEAGKPQLIAKAKQAGFVGARLRVKVDVPKPEPPPKAAKGKETDAKEAGPQPFTVTVEEEKVTGGWRTKEVVRDVTLTQETLEDGAKQVFVAYKNNKAPQLIDLVVPETKATLATLWPREQQQSLQIESALLTAPQSKDFQGDVVERTGVDGLEAIDDITMVCVPDLMTRMPMCET